jgi:hypothetical protein
MRYWRRICGFKVRQFFCCEPAAYCNRQGINPFFNSISSGYNLYANKSERIFFSVTQVFTSILFFSASCFVNPAVPIFRSRSTAIIGLVLPFILASMPRICSDTHTLQIFMNVFCHIAIKSIWDQICCFFNNYDFMTALF